MAASLDELDRKILALLQTDSSLSLDDIAKQAGASKTPVWNRIRTAEHDADWLARFLKAVQDRPEVLEAHRLAGDIDYILKVRVPNARAYDAFYQALIREVSIFNVTSQLSMEEIKNTTALPMPDPTPP